MQWLIDHVFSLIGAGTGVTTLVGGLVAIRRAREERAKADVDRDRAEVERDRAEVERDTEIAPTLLRELREAREEMRREIGRRDDTIETHAVRIGELGYSLADCQEKHARAEERHADCASRTEHLEQRWDHERSILHDAVSTLASQLEATAPTPEARAQARAVRRSISAPEMSAYRANSIDVDVFSDDEQ